MQNDTGGTAFGQIPIMLFAQNGMQPSISTTRLTTERPFAFCAFVAWQHIGCDTRGLVVEQKEREKDGVDDIAMEPEGFLFLTGGIMAMLGTEAIADLVSY